MERVNSSLASHESTAGPPLVEAADAATTRYRAASLALDGTGWLAISVAKRLYVNSQCVII